MSSAGTNGTDGTDLTTTLTTQGDIVYRDASGLARLGAGTAGQVLQTGGSGANPSWGTLSSDWVKVASDTLSGSTSSYSTDAFSSSYNTYKVYINDIKITSSNASAAGFRARNSSGDITGNDYFATGFYSYTTSSGGDSGRQGQYNVNQLNMGGWAIPDGNTQSGYAVYNYEWTFSNMNSSSNYKGIMCRFGGWERSGNYVVDAQLLISVASLNPLTGFTFNHLGGENFSNQGKILIYGLKE